MKHVTRVEEQVVIIERRGGQADCRSVSLLVTTHATYTREEAYRLVREQPGALYIRVGEKRVNLVPAVIGDLRYVRTAAFDTPGDALLGTGG